MDWQEFKANVRDIISARLDPLPDKMTVWFKEAQPHIGTVNKAIVRINMVAVREVGRAEQLSYDIEPDLLGLKVAQAKVATIQVLAQTYTHDGEYWAFRWLEQLRARLLWQDARAELIAAGIAVVSMGETKEQPNWVVDQREYNQATLDLQLSFLDTVTDDNYDGSWIEVVEITSPFLKPALNPIIVDSTP